MTANPEREPMPEETGTPAPAVEAPPASDSTTPPTAPAPGPSVEDLARELEREKAIAKSHKSWAEKSAKELDALKKATQTEQEQALDAARGEGRTAALRDIAPKLVSAEVRAAAAGRLSTEQQAALLDGLDHMRFLSSDGDVDGAKVAQLIDRLAPKPDTTNGAPQQTVQRYDFGQGRREQVTAPKGAAGKAEADRRFGVKTT